MALYDAVRFRTGRFAGEGIGREAVGYVIERHADDALEVEVSDPRTGATIAMVVARPDDLEPAEG